MLTEKRKAGTDVGNGGDVVVCRNTEGEILNVELLDFYEARVLRDIHYNLGDQNLNIDQKISHVLNRLLPLDPNLHQKLKKMALNFFKESKFLSGVELTDLPDSHHIALPKGCIIEQLAIQQKPLFEEDKRYIIDSDLYNKLDNNNKAGLILHEIIYRLFLKHGEINSIRARYFNSKLCSTFFEGLPLGDYVLFTDKLNVLKATDIINVGPYRIPIIGETYLFEKKGKFRNSSISSSDNGPSETIECLFAKEEEKITIVDFFGGSYRYISEKELKELLNDDPRCNTDQIKKSKGYYVGFLNYQAHDLDKNLQDILKYGLTPDRQDFVLQGIISSPIDIFNEDRNAFQAKLQGQFTENGSTYEAKSEVIVSPYIYYIDGGTTFLKYKINKIEADSSITVETFESKLTSSSYQEVDFSQLNRTYWTRINGRPLISKLNMTDKFILDHQKKFFLSKNTWPSDDNEINKDEYYAFDLRHLLVTQVGIKLIKKDQSTTKCTYKRKYFPKVVSHSLPERIEDQESFQLKLKYVGLEVATRNSLCEKWAQKENQELIQNGPSIWDYHVFKSSKKTYLKSALLNKLYISDNI